MLTVLGCGNLNRHDDGVGVVVAQRLDARLTPRQRRAVAVFDAGTDGMGVLLRAEGASALIVVDASRSGSEAGAIYDVPGAEIDSAPAPSFNLHDFRWDHALYAGRRMYGERFPRDVRVFLVEAEDLSFGIGLSAAVERAADRVVELLLTRIGEEMGPEPEAGGAEAGEAEAGGDAAGEDAAVEDAAGDAGCGAEVAPDLLVLRRGWRRRRRMGGTLWGWSRCC